MIASKIVLNLTHFIFAILESTQWMCLIDGH